MGALRARLRATLAVAAAQLWFHRRRALLAVAGVVLPVVMIALLVGLGHGVTVRGTEGLVRLNRDLWLAAPVDLAPGSVGGVENRIRDAHEVARAIGRRPDVLGAQAVGFQAVYVSPTGTEFDAVVGVGVTGTSAPIPLTSGDGFSTGDVHYANGSYDGPMSGEVIVDERLAAAMDLSVGDRLYVGGTVASARDHRFEVVGVTRSVSTFVGAPAVVLHLGELQTLTGTTASDPATYVAITLPSGTEPAAVASELEAAYPAYEVRTNREQLESIVAERGSVIASAVAIAVIAVVFGLALIANVLGLLVHHQRAELARLRASGLSTRTLVAVTVGQGLALGAVGGAVGVALAPAAAAALNRAVGRITGFDGLVRLRPWILLLAFGAAVLVGLLGGAVAGWRIGRIDPAEQLR